MGWLPSKQMHYENALLREKISPIMGKVYLLIINENTVVLVKNIK